MVPNFPPSNGGQNMKQELEDQTRAQRQGVNSEIPSLVLLVRIGTRNSYLLDMYPSNTG